VAPGRLMSRRRVAWAALMLVPWLTLRALLPVGFMPVIDGAGIHIGFCPGEAQPPGALLAHHHQPHHHQHGGADHGSPASTGHPPCLFALSGSPAFVPAGPAVAPLPSPVTAPAAELTGRAAVPAIVRTQTSRGPPLPA